MPLSQDLISNCEDTLNRIATELVLANAGSDDGLVPTYALVNELSGAVDQQEPKLHQACMHVRQALDELLDNSSPFDGRTRLRQRLRDVGAGWPAAPA
jgi:two-component system chemotaxis sensor kinase CheA